MLNINRTPPLIALCLSLSLASACSQTQNNKATLAQTPSVSAMSLNIYGHATMPKAAKQYAQIIHQHAPDVIGIQEGVQDWKIGPGLPTDYSRAQTLAGALGSCWQHQHQIFINTCQGNQFINAARFDLSDGINATRTGESAVISKHGLTFRVINVHWDHENQSTRDANARETIAEINNFEKKNLPLILLGDFNMPCQQLESMRKEANLTLLIDAGIDCIFANNFTGQGMQFPAPPSDHPGVKINVTRQLN